MGTTEPGSVLIVDDDPLTRLVLRTICERCHVRPVPVQNGAEAIHWLSRHPEPALILLDLNMPVMNGYQLLLYLTKHSEWARIPVIVISGNRLEGPTPQVCTFISKPFDLRQLQVVILGCLNREGEGG